MPLTVMIPTLNGAAIIEGQLEALAAQTGPSLGEVIVSDNGSTDNIAEVVRRWENRLPIRMVDASAHRGAPHARNTAVRAAKFDAFASCDCDDVVGPEWVKAMDESLQKADLATGPKDLARFNPPWLVQHFTKGDPEALRRPFTFGWLPFCVGANIGWTRRAWDAVGGFDLAITCLEDMDFSWSVQLAGFKFHYDMRALVYYRYNPKLRPTFRKVRLYGRWSVALNRKFKERGMPVPGFSWRGYARRWWRALGPGIARLTSPGGRYALVSDVATIIGNTEGMRKYKFRMG